MLVAATNSFVDSERDSGNGTKLERCDWGVTATQSSQQLSAVEVLLRVMGSTFLFASAIFLLPIVSGFLFFESFSQSEGLMLESLAVFTIFASGSALLYFSRIGIRKQIQVDTKRGEIRLGYLVKDRTFRKRMCIEKSDILSAFLHRSKSQAAATRLVLRLRNTPKPLVVFKGQEIDLKPILNEIFDLANPDDKSGGPPEVRRDTPFAVRR